MQHITAENHGTERGINVISEDVPRQKTVRELPDAYRNVPPAVLKDNCPVVPKLVGPVMPPTQDQDAITRNINNLVPRVLPMGKTLVGAGHETLQK